MQWVVTAYLLTQGVVIPTTAFLADRFGSKRAYVVSLIAFTLGSALCGVSWSLPMLVICRILQGAGGAILLPLSLTLIFQEFPSEQRGGAFAVLGIPTLVAPALGPIIGGYLVTYVNWQVIFFINVPVGIVAVALAGVFLREARVPRPPQLDIAGLVTVAGGLAATLYGLSEASTDGWSSGRVIGFLAAGVVLLCLFVLIEFVMARQGRTPLLDLRLFAVRSFTAANIAYVSMNIGLTGGYFLLPIYLQNLRGQTAFQTGLIVLPQALAAIVAIMASGRLVNRLGVRPVVIPGLALLAIAFWRLTTITLATPFAQLQVTLVLLGLALGLTTQLLVGALSEIQQARQIADGSTLTIVTRTIAASFGLAVLATLAQTQTKIHFAHLAEQVTATGPGAAQLAGLQQALVAQGVSATSAYTAALMVLYRLVQQQASLLALHDAFMVASLTALPAIVAAALIRDRRRPAPRNPSRVVGDASQPEDEARRQPSDAILVG